MKIIFLRDNKQIANTSESEKDIKYKGLIPLDFFNTMRCLVFNKAFVGEIIGVRKKLWHNENAHNYAKRRDVEIDEDALSAEVKRILNDYEMTSYLRVAPDNIANIIKFNVVQVFPEFKAVAIGKGQDDELPSLTIEIMKPLNKKNFIREVKENWTAISTAMAKLNYGKVDAINDQDISLLEDVADAEKQKPRRKWKMAFKKKCETAGKDKREYYNIKNKHRMHYKHLLKNNILPLFYKKEPDSLQNK